MTIPGTDLLRAIAARQRLADQGTLGAMIRDLEEKHRRREKEKAGPPKEEQPAPPPSVHVHTTVTINTESHE